MRSSTSLVTLAVIAAVVGGCNGATPPATSPSRAASPSSAVATSIQSASGSSSPSAITATLQPAGDAPLEGIYVGGVASTPAGYALLAAASMSGDPVVVSGSPDGRTWDRLDSTASGSAFSSLAAGPLGWVASQQIDSGSPSGGFRTVLWFSTGGTSWQQLPDQAGMGTSSLDAIGVNPLSAGRAGFAIAGTATEAGNQAPAVWVSPDGRAWTQAAALTALNVFGIDRVLVLPTGYVALGLGGVAEFSADGTIWRDLSTDPGSPFGVNSGATVTSVGSTLIVLRTDAAGALEIFSGDLGSDAGGSRVTWQHSAVIDGVFTNANASALTGSSGGALILGYDRRSFDPIAWTSPDGLAWHRTALDPATFGGGVPAIVAASGSAGASSFVAIGSRVNTAGDVRPQVWRSDDGTTWSAAGGDLLGVLPVAPTGPCPATAPTLVDDFLAMAPSLWPVCFGSRTLTVRGYIAGCGGCGGATDQQATPAWLLDPLGYSAFDLSPTVPTLGPSSSLGVMISPTHRVTVPAIATHVELTGHFDDPAAPTCRMFPLPGAFGSILPREETVAMCERAFVVTAIRKL
jgi:hypothetical protein